MMVWLSLALASPASQSAAAALLAHGGHDKVSQITIEGDRENACALGNAWLCDGWPTRTTMEAACTEGDVGACVGLAVAMGTESGRFSPDAPNPGRAAELFQAACSEGVLRACVAHAQLEQRGIGTEAAPDAALGVFRSACDKGEPWGCVHAGKAYQIGAGTAVDPVEARSHYQKACDAELSAGCGALGLSLHLGVGGNKDAGQALGHYQQACTEGYLPACENLGALYEEGLTSIPEAPRVPLLRDGCRAGNPSACGHLGDLLFASDPDAAQAAHQTACDAKLARGCRGVGLRLLGLGEIDAALPLIEGACQVGEPQACGAWGDLLAAGKHVERDLSAAGAARQTGCANGDAPSCLAVAAQLKKGKGLTKDRDAAEQMTQRACALGALEACP